MSSNAVKLLLFSAVNLLALRAAASSVLRDDLTHGRRLLKAFPSSSPPVVSQCSWPVDNYPPRCSLNFNTVLNISQTIKSVNYGARAQAFLTAASVYCGQYKKSECSWPCAFNGEKCDVFSALRYSVFDCPDSQAGFNSKCDRPHQENRAWCNSISGCTFTNSSSGPSCQANFFLGKPTTFKQDWYIKYYALYPRDYVGCCKGTNYRWSRERSCRNPNAGSDSPQACVARKGCRWDNAQLLCVVTDKQNINYLFEQDVREPVAQILANMSRECNAVKNAKACNSYKPVQVSETKVLFYMNQNLATFNNKLSTSRCRTQPLSTMTK